MQPTIGGDTSYPTESSSGGGSAGFVAPFKISSGVMRGTQIIANSDNSQTIIGKIPGTTDFGIQLKPAIGGANLTLDGTSNAFYVTDANGGKIGFGAIPDGSGDFGFFSVDPTGFLLFKIVGNTWNWYDKNNNTNTMRAGLLPDGNYGWVTVPPNNTVTEAFN